MHPEAQRYSVQAEAQKIFQERLLTDKRLQLPSELQEFAQRTTFDSNATSDPVLPCPLKMTESSAALWALMSTVGNLVCHLRYGIEQTVNINTEAATLFLISFALAKVNGKGLSDPELVKRQNEFDLGNSRQTYRRFATNVYPTKDGKWFHLHGSMNATPTLTMLGLPTSQPDLDEAASMKVISDCVRGWDSSKINQTANQEFRQAGTVCNMPEDFATSEQGKAISDHGLYVLERMAHSTVSKPVAWSAPASSSTRRPLEGIKILDVSRVIAAPTIAKLAALYGATVLRISCDKIPDMGVLLVDGNLGKRDVTLDLKSDDGKATLRKLIADCDVFLDGFRPGVMKRLGFGPEEVRRISEADGKGKGIVYVRENCYGWAGPLAHQSGWQQISDCVTGVSWLQGLFLGLNEPVVPLVPNSDYQTGMVGCIGIMAALLQRSKEGGSYLLSVSLTYYNMFLLALGEYPEDIKRELRMKHSDIGLRHYDDMHSLIAKTTAALLKKSPQIFKPEYMRSIPARLGKDDETLTFLGPAAEFSETKLGYDVGSCFHGYYQPQWPESA